jgi:hypothetical protein
MGTSETVSVHIASAAAEGRILLHAQTVQRALLQHCCRGHEGVILTIVRSLASAFAFVLAYLMADAASSVGAAAAIGIGVGATVLILLVMKGASTALKHLPNTQVGSLQSRRIHDLEQRIGAQSIL